MSSECVKVMVRVRPMNQKEKNEKSEICVEIDSQGQQVTITKPGEKDNQKTFGFDYCFGGNCKQESIYEESAFSLVESVVEGYNGTIFAYGQTGCGKTFTMMGDPSSDEMKGTNMLVYLLFARKKKNEVFQKLFIFEIINKMFIFQ